MKKDFYEILGVSKTDDDETIKKAYRKLAMKYHPDRNQHLSKEELEKKESEFKEIQKAYDTLGNPEKRKEYDNPSPFGNAHSGDFNFDFDNYFKNRDFSDIFGHSSTSNKMNDDDIINNFKNSRFNSNFNFTSSSFLDLDEEQSISVQLEDLVNHNTVEVEINVPQKYEVYDCSCMGVLSCSEKGCKKGKIFKNVIYKKEKIQLKLNINNINQNKIRLKGKGKKDKNQTGDLYLIVNPKLPIGVSFDENGQDIIMEKEITFGEYLNSEMTINTFHQTDSKNKQLNIKINELKIGQKFKLDNFGLNGGKLFVKISNIKMPILNNDTKQAIKNLLNL